MSRRPAYLLAAARILFPLSIFAAMVGCTGESGNPRDSDSSSAESSEIPRATGLPVDVEPRPSPQFERVTLAGDTFRMTEQLGRVVVVNFWATWCAPCVREIPELMTLHEALADSGVTVVGLSLDHEGFDVIRPFIARFEVSYPIVLDEGISDRFGQVFGLPVTFIVDRSGRIVQRVDGLIRPEALRLAIRKLLPAAVASPAPTPPSGSG